MALETFDFSSFPLRSLHVSDFFKKDLHIIVFFCGQVDCKLGTCWAPRSAKKVSFPRCQAGPATPAEEVEDPGYVSFPERNLLHN